jgi:hypothetical protein
LPLPPGLKAYPDQAKLDNQLHGMQIVGARSQRIALIADQPGEITVPELRVQWWDTLANRARETVLPAQRLTILPGAPSSNALALAPPTAQTGQGLSPGLSRNGAANGRVRSGTPTAAVDPRWIGVSLAFAVLWIATLVAWGWSRRGARVRSRADVSSASAARAEASTKQARRAFHDACRRSDPRAARNQLLAWVACARPANAPAGLRALARQLQDARVEALLLELDRACYAGERWDGAALCAALTELPKPDQGQPRSDVLQPLYP